MNITWKDAVTTILAILVVGIYYIKATEFVEIPLISTSIRWAIAALTLIGITMCAFSDGNTSESQNVLITAVSVLGVTALVLIISGLITGSKLMFDLLALLIVVMWAISTFRHFIKG